MFCAKCGRETVENQAFCASCGTPVAQAAAPGAPAVGISPKSKLAVSLLAFHSFLGLLGAHRFYIGKTGTAVLMLVLTVIGIATAWLFVGIAFLVVTYIWCTVDFVFAVTGRMKDSQGLLIDKW